MKGTIKISIPMPLVVSIEDVGWWSGKDGSALNQPFRTGMPRDHVPEDYRALAALGKGLDMRILAGFVLCEWDKNDILRSLPTATWMGKNWRNPAKDQALKEQAAAIIKEESAFLEFGLHGVGHEFWADSRMGRTEFHTPACKMRPKETITRHLAYFFRLMDQYGFDASPRTFIPPALQHSFGNPDNGFQKILNRFGIKYVTLIFNRAKLHSKPQTRTIAWENDVLLVERGEADVKWNAVASEPVFRFDRPIMALHWANVLHPDPLKNITVVEKWIRYIRDTADQKGMLLARDTKSCFTQYLHRVMSTVERQGAGFLIDLTWLDRVPRSLVGDAVFIRVDTPSDTRFRILGTQSLATIRPAEKNFLKLALPKQGKKILIQPDIH